MKRARSIALGVLVTTQAAAEVDYRGAAECPTREEFLRKLAESTAAPLQDGRRVEVSLGGGADAFVGRVRVSRADGVLELDRSVEGLRCEDVAGALALALALALDTTLDPREDRPPPPPPPIAQRPPEERPPPPGRASLGASTRAAFGRASPVSPELGLEGAWRVAPRLELRGAGVWSLATSVGSGTKVTDVGGRLGACSPIVPWIGPCLAIVAGRQRFSGPAGDEQRLWLSLEAGARAAARLGRFEAGALAGLSLAIPPRRIVDGRTGTPIFEMSPIGGYFGVDVGVHFP